MKKLTFRSSAVTYYGPHPCETCGRQIAKMGRDFGGSAFDYPDGPIYPNTEWHIHVCQGDDSAPLAKKAFEFKPLVDERPR